MNRIKQVEMYVKKAEDLLQDGDIFDAIEDNDINRVKQLIAQGVDVNAAHEVHGNTLLIISILQNNIDIIELLINKGADVNIENRHGETPLLLAVYEEDIDIVELLIDTGAGINIKDDAGDTPLSLAVGNNDKYIIRLLLNAGAEVTQKVIEYVRNEEILNLLKGG